MLSLSVLRRVRQSAAASLAAAFVFACGDGQSPQGTTQLSVLLKDAPGDVVSAVVTIEAVELVGEGGVLTLSETPTTVDLLTLASSTVQLVGDAVVPSGTYPQLRFRISGAYIEVENEGGSTGIYASSPDYPGLPGGSSVAGELRMPSFAQSGLKVTFPSSALTLTGDQKVIVVDFDVSQSFGQEAGQSGAWVMHPVITGTEIEATGSALARVRLDEGVTLPGGASLADFSARLTETGTGTSTTVPLSDGDGDSVFEAAFIYVVPGSYQLTLLAPAAVSSVTTAPAGPVTVEVESGEQAAVELVVTAAF